MFSAICVLLAFVLIVQLTLPMQFVEQNNTRILYSSRNNSKKNQVVIFDPKSGRKINPMLYLPIGAGNKRKPMETTGNLIELPRLWNPCSCIVYSCQCCLGVRLGESFNHKVTYVFDICSENKIFFNIDFITQQFVCKKVMKEFELEHLLPQLKVCAAIVYNPELLEIQLRITHNQRIIINIGFSVQNPPTLCTPILFPFPVNSCLRTYDIRTFNGNIQICLSLILKIFMNDLFEFQLNCLRFGANGVQFVKPLQAELEEEGSNDLAEGGTTTGDRVAVEDGMEVDGNVDGDELLVTYSNGNPKRQQIELEENYSGISVEQPIEGNTFLRKGRVPTRKGLLM